MLGKVDLHLQRLLLSFIDLLQTGLTTKQALKKAGVTYRWSKTQKHVDQAINEAHGNKRILQRSLCSILKPVKRVTNRTKDNFKSLNSTTEEFVAKALKIHGHTYDYSKVKYVRALDKVCIVCKKHGEFYQQPSAHLSGQGCMICGYSKNRFEDTETFIKKSIKKHGNTYDYSKSNRVDAKSKVVVTCRVHGDFLISASDHYLGYGCKQCNPKRYSKVAIQWILKESKSRRLQNVQHAENNGEFFIPDLRIFVDGYHKRTKTIFEFYGDDWHGNLNKHRPNTKCHPFNTKTARQLFKETMKREQKIIQSGYRLIVIWESDYYQNKKATSYDGRTS